MTATPHDALFKAAFESPAHAGALFRGDVKFDDFRARIEAAVPAAEEATMTMAEELIPRVSSGVSSRVSGKVSSAYWRS